MEPPAYARTLRGFNVNLIVRDVAASVAFQRDVLGAEVVMPDGELRKVSLDDPGPDLLGLFVGAEGTLGVATKIWLKLTPKPETIETILVPFSALESAIQAVSDIIAKGVVPRVLEAMDKLSIRAVEEHLHAGYPTDADAVLLIELDGSVKLFPRLRIPNG